MFIFQRNKKPDIIDPGTTVFLLVGLGNPGREYRSSRHNIGFMVIDRLAEDLGVKLPRVQN